jgi:hypothetical protein
VDSIYLGSYNQLQVWNHQYRRYESTAVGGVLGSKHFFSQLW